LKKGENLNHTKNIGAIVLLASFCSFAGIDLRIGGGLNMSNETYAGDYTLPPNFKKNMHVGFNAGASAAVPFSRQWGIVAGISYETRGSEQDIDTAGTGSGDSSSRVFSMRYLQIPVLFSYRPIPALAIALGPELGIFLGGKTKNGSVSKDMVDIRTIDIGASLTLDYTIANMIAVGAGYYLGFLNTDNSSSAEILKGGIRENNIKLFVAYVLHL
jgi:hypothetical protein